MSYEVPFVKARADSDETNERSSCGYSKDIEELLAPPPADAQDSRRRMVRRMFRRSFRAEKISDDPLPVAVSSNRTESGHIESALSSKPTGDSVAILPPSLDHVSNMNYPKESSRLDAAVCEPMAFPAPPPTRVIALLPNGRTESGGRSISGEGSG